MPDKHSLLQHYGTKLAAQRGIMNTFLKSRLIKAQRGFTLVEMMIVVGLIAFGLAIGVPVYNTTVKPTADLNGAARQLFSDIQLARLRAVSENVYHGLDFSAGPMHIVFKDNNSDSQRNAGDQDIKTISLANDYASVQFDTSKADGDGISFGNNAFSMTPRGLPTNGGSVFLVSTKGAGRQVIVNTMGGVRIVKY